MSWSYSGNPASSALDEVRFLIGDTDSTVQQLSDEEINYNVTMGAAASTSGNFLAAAFCAEGIAGRFARLADKSVGDLHISYNTSFKQFESMASKLRRRADLAGVVVYSGGESIAGKAADRTDTDLVQPGIRIDGMNNPGPIDPEDQTSLP